MANTISDHVYELRTTESSEGSLLVWLKNPFSGEENYMGNDGGFSGNVNSDRYAAHFDTKEDAIEQGTREFKRVYCTSIDPAWHRPFVWLNEDSK